jgi:hypothetical protein
MLANKKKRNEKSADDTGNAVESLALPVGTFHGIRLREIHPFGHPASRAIRKGG